MNAHTEALYQERKKRYATALRNEKPDTIPIRPFVAEFTARHAGYTCQQVTHDYSLAFDAACKCASDFDWDAVVPNMVYVWTGLTEAIGIKYYGVPGIEVPPDKGFQYVEPPEAEAHMRADEYDQLIEDPTGFLFNVWLPRVVAPVVPIGEPATYRNNLSFLKGGVAMFNYFNAFGPQIERLRTECGTLSAIAGIFKAPFDILADKLRGYVGLTVDMLEQPDKVLAAAEALMPHLLHVALATSDPAHELPVGFWMHRGCVPFINHAQFDRFYWSTLKPIIEELWDQGHQTLFYAEGDWGAHLDTFAQLPEKSIIFHLDRTDPLKAHKALGDQFCLSGGVPNFLLSHGTPDEVRERCTFLIDNVARDGGYIMDASAIMQDDAKPENVRAMTEFTREHGVYDGPAYPLECAAFEPKPDARPRFERPAGPPAGTCVPWVVRREELPGISGDEGIIQRAWEDIDVLANMYIWQVLLSF
ncbi:MAG TPA: hypothetical protein ENN80_04610 [Candidatus Hydrogenedentes bacterium]|nr:hypothetical protein [Candidatus Hydrogenedentota bacterium]